MKYSETLTADCSKEGFMDLEESSSFLLKEIQRVQPGITGGGERNRTADLYVANVAL